MHACFGSLSFLITCLPWKSELVSSTVEVTPQVLHYGSGTWTYSGAVRRLFVYSQYIFWITNAMLWFYLQIGSFPDSPKYTVLWKYCWKTEEYCSRTMNQFQMMQREKLYCHWLGSQLVGRRNWVFVSATAVTDGKMQSLLWTGESGSEVRAGREGDMKGGKDGEKRGLRDSSLRHSVHQYSSDVADHCRGRLQLCDSYCTE